MEELKPAEILKAVHTCGASFCTTGHHECAYGDDGCIDCVDRLEADFEALIDAGDDLIIRHAAPENKPLTFYDQIRAMSLEEMATILSEAWNRADYEDGDWDPEVMEMLKAPAHKPEGDEKT